MKSIPTSDLQDGMIFDKAVYIDPGASVRNFRMPTITDAAAGTQMPRSGSSTFNGTTGRVITHNVTSTGNGATYKVQVTPTATIAGHWYITKASNSFTVYSTESGDAGAFDWTVLEDAEL